MVKKLQKSVASKASSAKKSASKASPDTESPLANAVKDSAQQIWQAGLGAFNRAQAEGSKAFEALVKEGVTFQRKTQSAAEEKISEATSKMSSMATDISAKATGQWDKLETIFEDRVAKALGKLGVPSAKDINALIVRVDELNKSVPKPPRRQPNPVPRHRPKRQAARPPNRRPDEPPRVSLAQAARRPDQRTRFIRGALRRLFVAGAGFVAATQ
jgi:poly(hydroxyalkanoate) granule-associated protein